MKLPPIRSLANAWSVVALAAALVIARADSWRLIPCALALAAAVLTTRTRYATQTAVALIVAVAVIALLGHGPARDGRDAPRLPANLGAVAPGMPGA